MLGVHGHAATVALLAREDNVADEREKTRLSDGCCLSQIITYLN